MHINKTKQNQKGFTLIELIMVIAIMGILLSMGIGSFGPTRHRAATKGLSDDLTALLTTARINAMTTGSTVTLCPVDDITSVGATTTCSTTWEWDANSADNKKGWIVFKDQNANDTLDDPTFVIEKLAFDSRKNRVGIVDVNQTTALRFTRKGLLSSTSLGRTFIIGDTRENAKYKGKKHDRNVIIASNTGRIKNVLATEDRQ